VIAGGRIAEHGTPDELLADPNSHFTAMLRADSAFALAA
jgi:ABC-type multidrug transport system fused ATPase/permease subunit